MQRRLQGDQPLFQNRDAKNPEMRWSYWALHSTATALRRAGVALDVIQHIAGQADSRSTEVYAKVSLDHGGFDRFLST